MLVNGMSFSALLTPWRDLLTQWVFVGRLGESVPPGRLYGFVSTVRSPFCLLRMSPVPYVNPTFIYRPTQYLGLTRLCLASGDDTVKARGWALQAGIIDGDVVLFA